MCVFAIGARTVGATGLKFGTDLGFHPEMVIVNIQASPPTPLGVGAWRRLESHWPRESDGHKRLSWEVLLLLGHQPSTELKP